MGEEFFSLWERKGSSVGCYECDSLDAGFEGGRRNLTGVVKDVGRGLSVEANAVRAV